MGRGDSAATTAHRHDIRRLKDRLGLLEQILGLSVQDWPRCQGSPLKCGDFCTPDSCPLRSNRVTELGSLIVEVLEEFRWHRAMTEELVAQGVVPENTTGRIGMRVRRQQLQEKLEELESTLESVRGVQVLMEKSLNAIAETRAEIETLTQQLGETP